jgi:hypothetical protein
VKLLCVDRLVAFQPGKSLGKRPILTVSTEGGWTKMMTFVDAIIVSTKVDCGLCLAKTLTDFEMNNIAGTPPPAFCYNSDHVQRVFALVRSLRSPLSYTRSRAYRVTFRQRDLKLRFDFRSLDHPNLRARILGEERRETANA